MASKRLSFFSQPLRYIRYQSHENPAYFWSVVVAGLGPVFLAVAPPVRRYFGDFDRPRIPSTYPIPPGPRPKPKGFEDE